MTFYNGEIKYPAALVSAMDYCINQEEIDQQAYAMNEGWA